MNLKGLDNLCIQEIEIFKKQNKEFLENPIIKSFLKNEKNWKLFLEVICNPTDENKELLDKEFKKFYFGIRFTAFISTALYFNAVNFDKRYRKMLNRYTLTVDKPLKEEEDISFKDMITDSEAEIQIEWIIQSDDIKDYIADPVLYEAILTLSDKQREVINLAYVKGLSDTEISKVLNKSQQAISKTRKKALKNIYNFINEKGEIKK
ncbi:RNA polymerase sigma factor (sigma-70 family) [Anoxybacillus calidus]|uniref:RNA polymerase sigma factor (Sigma-70 family) n=1 Tax=[Anoxybacillus] calidus TaxID=575178 RepID=A0A7V9Z0A8_9BACL|nr:sigma-70 family RNA polymerase sigma factor [Anoxybacillus calidus]MBA2871543.1 RNA polymerase sigma factor (sigma-70 family) [Anoxybacillus calidus]